MNILIIEDEKAAATRIVNKIKEIRPDYSVVACIESIEIAIEWFSKNPLPDLIFLDVQLSDGLSFDIFKTVDIPVPVIFTTAYDSFAIKAFELNSIDYLLKPINSEKLETAIKKFESIKEQFISSVFDEKIKSLLQSYNLEKEPYKSRFLIPQCDGYIPVLTKDIAYIFAKDNSVVITTRKDQKFRFHHSLDKLEQELDPTKFWRANRAFIISYSAVKKAHNYFNYKIKLDLEPKALKDVIVSRNKVSEFKQWFNM